MIIKKVRLMSVGKVAAFLYGLLGAAMVQYGGANSAITFGGNLGLGMRFFITRWLTFRTELRDLIYVESAQPNDSLRNQILVEFGLSMFFPTTFNEG